jgi:hypothetical protein
MSDRIVKAAKGELAEMSRTPAGPRDPDRRYPRKGIDVLTSSGAEGVGDAVDIVEPRCDQRDLEYRLVLESRGVKPFVIFRRDLGSSWRNMACPDPLWVSGSIAAG